LVVGRLVPLPARLAVRRLRLDEAQPAGRARARVATLEVEEPAEPRGQGRNQRGGHGVGQLVHEPSHDALRPRAELRRGLLEHPARPPGRLVGRTGPAGGLAHPVRLLAGTTPDALADDATDHEAQPQRPGEAGAWTPAHVPSPVDRVADLASDLLDRVPD